MRRGCILRFASVAFALWAGAEMATARAAEETPGLRTVGGLTIYLGVLPAAMVHGHQKDHTDGVMQYLSK